MPMNYRFFTTGLLLIKFTILGVFAQSGITDRDEYFRRMELRAIELSRKMAELTGTEPIEMIEPRPSPSFEFQPANTDNRLAQPVSDSQKSSKEIIQDSFDSLPGPMESNETSISKKYEDKVGEGTLFSQSTTEELKGSYFLKSSFVFQAPFDSDVKGVNSLAGKVGDGIGVVVGRRIENWTLSARFGHTHQNSQMLIFNLVFQQMEMFKPLL